MENDNVQISRASLWKYSSFAMAIVLLVMAFIFVGRGSVDEPASAQTGDAVKTAGGNAQKITLGLKNYNYYPNTIKAKAGQPVSITLDSSVYGCYRSFVIKDLGVSAYSKSPSQTIDFTPAKKGSFRFSCSMGMGYGTLVVE